MAKKSDFVAVVLLILTMVGLWYLASPMSDWKPVLEEFLEFATGSRSFASLRAVNFEEVVPTTLWVLFFEMTTTILIRLATEATTGKIQGEHANERLLDPDDKLAALVRSLIVVGVEEGLARWLAIEYLPTRNSVPMGGVYAYMLAGNAVWASLHLLNLKSVRDWHPTLVLPPFVAGLFYAFLFVKFGLLVVILAHFAHNTIIMLCYWLQ